LFIADANENALSDVTLLNPSLNLGRIWVQERSGSLFFRVEFLGRAVRSLADLDLTIDLDTDGNLNNGAEFQMRLSPNQTGLFQGSTRKADFAYLNLTERFVDLGVRLGDLNSPTALQVRATLKDLVVGCTDTAPDLGWARLTRADNQVGVFFGVSPAAGTLLGERAQSPDSPVERSLSLWFIVDARTARIETRQTNLALPAAQSTLFSDLSQSFTVEIKQGPPAQLTLDFRVGTNSVTEVLSTQRQVTVTATVLDASGNGVAGQRVQLTVSPAELGNFNGATTTELTTDSNGQATTTLSLTGRLGTLTVQGQVQVLDTSITDTKPLAIQQGPPAKIQLITVPALDSQNIATIQVGGKVVVKAALTDGSMFEKSSFMRGKKRSISPFQDQPPKQQKT
jgi:hypothetical protein